ncbi:MAG: CHAT domain-containing protein [Chitinophagales bacterium]|nr:CHAT domain-containing protein [Chitinophagales bacterium]
MRKPNLFLISLLIIAPIYLLTAQEMSPEEKRRFEKLFYGNHDFKTGYEYHVKGQIYKAREYYTKAMYSLREEKKWMGMIRVGGRVITTYSGSENDSLGIAVADTLFATVNRAAPLYKDSTAAIYKGLLNVYYDRLDNKKGLEVGHKLGWLLKKKYQTDIINPFVDIYGLMGQFHYREGNIDSAFYYLQTAHDIIPQLERVSPDKASFTLAIFGDLLFSIGNYGGAINMLERATDYAKAIFGEDNPEIGRYYSSIAGYYQSLGEHPSSIEYYQKALYLYEAGEGRPDIFYYHIIPNVHLLLCADYIQLDQLDKADYHHKKAYTYIKNSKKNLELSTDLFHVKGDLLLAHNQTEEALSFYNKAKALYIKNIAAGIYPFSSNEYNLMILNSDIAKAHQVSGSLDSAIFFYKEAISMSEKYHEEQLTALKANWYHTLADIYMGTEQLDSALYYNQNSLISTCHYFTPEDYFTLPQSKDFQNITETYLVLRQKANVIRQLAQLVPQEEEQLRLLKKALDFITLSDAVHVENLKKASLYRTAKSATLVENSIYNYKEGLNLAYEVYTITSDPSYIDQSFYFTQKMKAQQLWMSILDSKSKNFAKLDQELLNQERDLLADIAYYESKIREAAANNDTASVYKYRNENLFGKKEDLAKLYRQLESNNPDYYETKYAFIPEDEQSLKNVLTSEEALIEYVFTDSLLYTFVLTPEKQFKLYQSKISNGFAKQVDELNALLQNSAMLRKSSRERFIQLSHQLYQALIQPIADDIKDKNRLIIIGDGLTNYIPFGTLVSANSTNTFDQLEYLIKDFEIVYHYSSTLFAKARKNQVANNTELFAFAPVYDEIENNTAIALETNNLRAFNEDGTFNPLPESEKEVNNIAHVFEQDGKKSAVYLRQKANEAALKHQLEQTYQYIHIAGHSFADLENPNFSGVACYSDTALVEEDGILYSGEIYGLSTAADLITLSSCESGYGKLQGTEGLLGLNRAFIYAGAQNVVFSLWKVYDKVSAQLMIDFYEGVVREDLPYSNSLRQAKLKQISNPATASPHYWGAYLLIGR